MNAADHELSLGVATEIVDLSDGQPHTRDRLRRIDTLRGDRRRRGAVGPGGLCDRLFLRDGGTAYIGFTASTGDAAQIADVAGITITFLTRASRPDPTRWIGGAHTTAETTLTGRRAL